MQVEQWSAALLWPRETLNNICTTEIKYVSHFGRVGVVGKLASLTLKVSVINWITYKNYDGSYLYNVPM